MPLSRSTNSIKEFIAIVRNSTLCYDMIQLTKKPNAKRKNITPNEIIETSRSRYLSLRWTQVTDNVDSKKTSKKHKDSWIWYFELSDRQAS
eukprot:gene14440-5498_t